MKNYLYIEKRQRIPLKNGKLPRRATRITEEFESLRQRSAEDINYSIAYISTVTVGFAGKDVNISITDIEGITHNIFDFTHIIFGGHFNMKEYELKQMIIKECGKRKDGGPLIQNANLMRRLPYYTKLDMTYLLARTGFPYIDTDYFGENTIRETSFKNRFPIVVKHYAGANDLVQEQGKTMIRKNVFFLSSSDDWSQDRLCEHNPADYIVQPAMPIAEDLRVFVSRHKVIGGWRRRSLSGFLTVGGEREYVLENSPSPAVRKLSENISKAWEADFIAIDFMFDEQGNPYVLEFSMHPGFWAYENKTSPPADDPDQTPVNVARYIVESFSR